MRYNKDVIRQQDDTVIKTRHSYNLDVTFHEIDIYRSPVAQVFTTSIIKERTKLEINGIEKITRNHKITTIVRRREDHNSHMTSHMMWSHDL